MTNTSIRQAVAEDYDSIVRLNDSEADKTSPMDLEKLTALAQLSCYLKVVTRDSDVAAFLLCMREGVAYENDNYNWLSSRFKAFVYVDRIVVGSRFAGTGIGSMLYRDLFEFTRSEGVSKITCEYNLEPPNLVSQAFHRKFGFRECGTRWSANQTRQVSYQVAEV